MIRSQPDALKKEMIDVRLQLRLAIQECNALKAEVCAPQLFCVNQMQITKRELDVQQAKLDGAREQRVRSFHHPLLIMQLRMECEYQLTSMAKQRNQAEMEVIHGNIIANNSV